MSTVLLIHTYQGANKAVQRHWEFFKRSNADEIVGVCPVTGGCLFPERIPIFISGDGKYMEGPNLCIRLVETLDYIWRSGFDHGIIVEYDTLILRELPIGGVHADRTGGRTWDSKATFFSHNPWIVDAESAKRMAHEGKMIISEGLCEYGTPESSPDVFFGLICDRLKVPIQNDVKLFTRNTIESEEDVILAREAFRNGHHAIHGVKTERILNSIVKD